MKKAFKYLVVTFFALVGMTVITSDLIARFEIDWERPPLNYWKTLGLTIIIVLLRVYEDRHKPSAQPEVS